MNALIVFVGAGLGGVVRHLLHHLLTVGAGSGFPWGTLIINISGSTALGIVTGLLAFRKEIPVEFQLFLTTGILGGYTTFSAFSIDTVVLYGRGDVGLAGAYVAASVLLSILGLAAGLSLVRFIAN